MKILVITSSYPRWEGDIAGGFVKRWVQQCASRGAHVDVLCWEDDTRRAPDATHPRVRVEWVAYAGDPASQRLFYGSGAPEHLEAARALPARARVASQTCRATWAMAQRASKHIQRARPNLIVGHWLAPAGALAAGLSRLHGIPCGVVTHSGGVHLLNRLGSAGRALARAIDAGARGQLSFTQHDLQETFSRMVGRPLSARVLPMGFDAPTQQAGGKDWLVLGRLVPIKRVDRALAAFAASRASAQGRALHVVGDGPCLDALRAQADTYARARIRFHGLLTGAARDEVMRRCRVAVFSSTRLPSGRAEGLPVSFLEASGAGLVPLVSREIAVGHLLADAASQRLPESPDKWAAHIDTSWEALSAPGLSARTRALVAPYEWSNLGELWWQRVCQWAQPSRP